MSSKIDLSKIKGLMARSEDDQAQLPKGILVIHVWSISCPACKINMSLLQALRDQYADRGLGVIAAHMPRSEHELDETAVRAVATEIGVTETLVLDNDHAISEALEVKGVPAYYLFDAEGTLRRKAMGEFGIRLITEAVKRLLGDVAAESLC